MDCINFSAQFQQMSTFYLKDCSHAMKNELFTKMVTENILGQREEKSFCIGRNWLCVLRNPLENQSYSSQLKMVAIDEEHPGWQQSTNSILDDSNHRSVPGMPSIDKEHPGQQQSKKSTTNVSNQGRASEWQQSMMNTLNRSNR